MEYSLDIFSFISGALLVLIAAYVNQKVKDGSDKKAKIRESEYRFYLKLNDLYQLYFWFATNEMHNKETSDEIYADCHKIAASLARDVHDNDGSEFTEELLRVLYDESIPTCMERWQEMAALLDKMAAKLTPVHKKLASKLDDTNIKLMAQSGFVSKAPASSRFRLRV